MLASLVNQKKNRHFPCIYGVVEPASLLKQKKSGTLWVDAEEKVRENLSRG